jgi:hypothetical protein
MHLCIEMFSDKENMHLSVYMGGRWGRASGAPSRRPIDRNLDAVGPAWGARGRAGRPLGCGCDPWGSRGVERGPGGLWGALGACWGWGRVCAALRGGEGTRTHTHAQTRTHADAHTRSARLRQGLPPQAGALVTRTRHATCRRPALGTDLAIATLVPVESHMQVPGLACDVHSPAPASPGLGMRRASQAPLGPPPLGPPRCPSVPRGVPRRPPECPP